MTHLMTSSAAIGDAFIVKQLFARKGSPLNRDLFLKTSSSVQMNKNSCIFHHACGLVGFIVLHENAQGIPNPSEDAMAGLET